uniref:N,N-dimethylformamidase beta subunit family domain-containing protein n=1 Tax=Mesorhizobium sp. M0050 TaxID=2956861 RepID=UPI00333B9021
MLVTGSHPEYWSLPMWQAPEGFLARGGRLMYLGGNGFAHAIDFHPQRWGLVELRRRHSKNGSYGAGKAYSSFTGRLCGAWRDLGRPEQSLVGVGYRTEALGLSTAAVIIVAWRQARIPARASSSRASPKALLAISVSWAEPRVLTALYWQKIGRVSRDG